MTWLRVASCSWQAACGQRCDSGVQVLSPRKPSTSPAWCCVAVGLEYGGFGVGTPRLPRLEYALELVLYMLSQHHAIGLQTDCMVTVLAPVVEAAELPRVCPTSLAIIHSVSIGIGAAHRRPGRVTCLVWRQSAAGA